MENVHDCCFLLLKGDDVCLRGSFIEYVGVGIVQARVFSAKEAGIITLLYSCLLTIRQVMSASPVVKIVV